MKYAILAIIIVAVSLGFISMIPQAHATSVTLTGPDEEVTGDSKICIYEGHGTTETITIPKSRNCPYAKTFDLDEDDE